MITLFVKSVCYKLKIWSMKDQGVYKMITDAIKLTHAKPFVWVA